MVMLSDCGKMLLLQRLNIGYQCTACRLSFGSRRELINHLDHVHLNPRKGGDYKCSTCGKLFSNDQIFRLHCQIHGLKEVSVIQERIRAQKSNLNQIEKQITAISSIPDSKKEKKATGLTKVRMEDCLRCDSCSCIYVDKNDYYKHMRNFHKITDFDTHKSANAPAHFKLVDKPNNRPSKRKCPTSKAQKQTNERLANRSSPLQKRDKLFQATMKDIIKDRWTQMISRSIREDILKVNIKPDPDGESCDYLSSEQDDMTHLLSQVEVKIETLDDR